LARRTRHIEARRGRGAQRPLRRRPVRLFRGRRHL